MNNGKRRYVLSDQPHGHGTLGDYKLGKKINLTPFIHKNLLSKYYSKEITDFLRVNGWLQNLPKTLENFLSNSRMIRVLKSDSSVTNLVDTENTTLISLQKGHDLDMRARIAPLRVYLGTYNACNLQCDYCCASSSKKRAGYFDLNEVDVIANHLYRLGVIEVRLGESGEPTQHPQFIEVVNQLKKCGLFVSLNTGGVMSTEIRKFIAESGKIDILIQSLDGTANIHDGNRGAGSYKEAIKTIKAASRGNKTKIRLNYVLNNKTQASLEDLAKLAYGYGAEIYILPMRPSGRGVSHFEQYLSNMSYKDVVIRMDKLRKMYKDIVIHSTYDVLSLGGDHLVDHAGSCPAGVEGCCLSPEVTNRDGFPARIRMFGCSFMVDIKEKHSNGNIIFPFLADTFDDVNDFRKRFFDVWQNSFDIFRGETMRNKVCMECDMLKERRCTGHCAALAYYQKIHPEFDASIYCAIGVSKDYENKTKINTRGDYNG